MRRILYQSIIACVICMLLSPVASASASFIKPEQQADQSKSYEAGMLEYVKTYTPDQVSRWQEELTEHDQLRSKLREIKKSKAFKKQHQEMRQELQEKLDSGEITQEQAKKLLKEKHQAYAQKHKQWKEEGKKLRSQLEKAIEQGNKDEITSTLDAMLERLTKVNDKLAERIGSIEAPSES